MKSQLNATTASDIDTCVAQYNNTLSQLLDLHAPLVTRSITLRPHTPWYDEELREHKRVKHCCERKWVSSGLEVHKQMYHDECKRYKDSLASQRQNTILVR